MTPKRSIIPLFVPHAGCENTCVFCDQRQITGKTTPVTANDVAETVNKASNIIKADTVAEIAFFGGSFTAVPISKQNEL
jgi:histone acetyltransferase (RNA polymerase elongator complex component)